MYVEHEFLKQPEDGARLWRYMTSTTFLGLVLGRALYFARLSRFEDPFEGVPPPAIVEALRGHRGSDAPEPGQPLAAWRQMIELCRATVCASSWHLGEEESEAMWKLYGRHEDGLAIVSTLPSIRAAFRDSEVTGGLVDYSGREFEPGTTDANLLQWATTKRPSYKHENEFRLLARCDEAAEGGGRAIPVDPQVLIEHVVLSPRMERWQVDVFNDLLRTLHFGRPVRASSLLTAPF